MEWLSSSETIIRSGIFFSGFIVFSLIGIALPFRKSDQNRNVINIHNFALIAVNALMQKALGPLTLIALATYLEQQQLGFFNLLSINPYLEFTVTIVFFDLIIYTQHLLTHRIPLLWRLHRVHHTDTGFDTSTALRFHPIETLMSLVVKSFFVVLTGASPLAIFIFEILINFSAMFQHSNFRLPSKVENIVSKFIVTPDIHRIHHSVLVEETDSNFAFFISAWDRIFKTRTAKAKHPQNSMPIGITTHRNIEDQSFWRLLMQPFKS